MITFLGVLYMSAALGLELNMYILLGAFLLDWEAWEALQAAFKRGE